MNKENSIDNSEHISKNSMSHKWMYWLYMLSITGGLVMLIVALISIE
ncbi:MAG: hypothetical protein KAR30_09585 [Gammaproteobacteria bacterium]|nr:hypothetical protein [Gammaproteobacteria bacterium]